MNHQAYINQAVKLAQKNVEQGGKPFEAVIVKMTPIDLAEKYMGCVFKTGNLEELRNILSDDLQFRGPFFNFNSADAYVDSIKNDQPIDFKYGIIKSILDGGINLMVRYKS